MGDNKGTRDGFNTITNGKVDKFIKNQSSFDESKTSLNNGSINYLEDKLTSELSGGVHEQSKKST